MSRYYFSPINHKDFMGKYLNSLKTGEIMLDTDLDDIYVTEEGYNLPIPSTSNLRKMITNYLENTIDGMNFRKNEIPMIIDSIERLKDNLETRQNEINYEYESIEGQIKNDLNNSKYLSKITKNNINQLGDLKMVFDEIDYDILDERIFGLIDDFNNINIDSGSGIYNSGNNQELIEIWNDIQSLMQLSNTKLKNMGTFEGSAVLQKNTTQVQNIYDTYYSRRQFNFTLGGHPDIGMANRNTNITSETEYLNTVMKAREGFIKWFYGQKYLDPLTRQRFPTHRGSGLWYKGFQTKRDEATRNNNLHGRRNPQWDLFEAVPLEGQNNSMNVNTPTVPYIRSATNYILFENSNSMNGNNSTNYSYNTAPNTNKIVRYNSYGNQEWEKDFRHIGDNYRTNNELLNRIVARDNGMQRTPKYFYNNHDQMSAISKGAPTFPVIVRDWYWISHTGLVNREGMLIRLGLVKSFSVTEISTSRYGFNESRGWTAR